MDIIQQLKKLLEKISSNNEEIKYARKKYIEPLYDKAKNYNNEFHELKAKFVSSLDLSEFTFKLQVSHVNGDPYFVIDNDEEFLKLIPNGDLKINSHTFMLGDDILKIIVNDYDVSFTSDNLLAAMERHKFKLDTTDIEQLMKKKTQELEELMKIIETN